MTHYLFLVFAYHALKAVPLRSLNRHRLHLVLSHYMTENYNYINSTSYKGDTKTMKYNQKILTPKLVAEKESFLPIPFLPPDESVNWLSIGDSLIDICPNGLDELQGLMLYMSTNEGNDEHMYEKYILKPTKLNGGLLIQLTFLEEASDIDILRGMYHAYLLYEFALREVTLDTAHTHSMMNSLVPVFVEQLQDAGWTTKERGSINVECASSHRLNIQKSTLEANELE